PVAVPQQRSDRRAHPGEFGFGGDAVDDLLVRVHDGQSQRFERIIAVLFMIEVRDFADRDGRRDVAARVAAHAVGDDRQVGAGIAGVLIIRPGQADVRLGDIPVARSGIVRWSARCLLTHERSSSTVLPIVMGSFALTGTLPVTSWPESRVPLVDSRSSRIHPSWPGKIRACLLETKSSPSTSVLSGDRPIRMGTVPS